jgi:hypothetical protein
MWVCNPTNSNQLWSYDESTGLLQSNRGNCLTTTDAGTAGTSVTQSWCESTNVNQQWLFSTEFNEPTSQYVYNSDAAGGCYSVWLQDSHYYRLHPLRFPLPGGLQHAGLKL